MKSQNTTDDRLGLPSASGIEAFKPGVEGTFYGLDYKTYAAAPGVRHSHLKEMRLSPLHYMAAVAESMSNQKQTDALIFGTLFDWCRFDHPTFLKMVVQKPEGITFNTSEGKAWLKELGSPSESVPGPSGYRVCEDGRIVAPDDVAKRLLGMVRSVKSHPVIASIHARSQKQVSVFWRHAETGQLLKCRPDEIAVDDANLTVIVDTKTTEDASDEAFSKSVARFAYHRQADLYMRATGASYFLFVAVEKSPPFACRVFQLDEESIALGRQENERDLAKLYECITKDEWPAYPTEITTIGVPAWAKRGLL